MKKLFLGSIASILGFIAVFSGFFIHNNISEAKALGGAAMITIEASSGRILYGHNYHIKRPMASVTKILTAIAVIDNTNDLNKKISVPKEAVGIEGSSIYLAANEQISILDLLYGLMLQSGNDCAVALALVTSGSIEKFSILMNETALKAGAKNSNFVNPHGLHHDNHYTTAYDLAMITAYAMQNETFKQISSTRKQVIERTRENGITHIQNKNRLLASFEGADGVKTGFTKRAGRTLVASATREEMQIIAVVLNCGPMFEDCATLMNRAFAEFTMQKIACKYQKIADVSIQNSRKKTVAAGVLEDFYYPLKNDEQIKITVNPINNLAGPLKKGGEAGKISFMLNNQLLFETNLYTIEDAPAFSIKDYLKKILTDW
ncbi:MAG: D-alanyl-D-alanine carboxypeptidase [Firmicutes bacterium]|nr:D-alanyl-D-alanine carboxypeptidase [Bacillota bacterium]